MRELSVGHNILLAHASTVALFREKYQTQGCEIGITLNSTSFEPYEETEEGMICTDDHCMHCVLPDAFDGQYIRQLNWAMPSIRAGSPDRYTMAITHPSSSHSLVTNFRLSPKPKNKF